MKRASIVVHAEENPSVARGGTRIDRPGQTQRGGSSHKLKMRQRNVMLVIASMEMKMKLQTLGIERTRALNLAYMTEQEGWSE
jgi:hypothetical protein